MALPQSTQPDSGARVTWSVSECSCLCDVEGEGLVHDAGSAVQPSPVLPPAAPGTSLSVTDIACAVKGREGRESQQRYTHMHTGSTCADEGLGSSGARSSTAWLA